MMLLWLHAYIFLGLLLSMPFSCIFTVLFDLMCYSQHIVCAAVDARSPKVICNAGGVRDPLDMDDVRVGIVSTSVAICADSVV